MAVVINLGLNLVLIYHFQSIGAALSAVITAVCVWLLYTRALSTHVELTFDWRFIGKFLFPCGSILLVVLLGFNLAWTLALGGALYVSLLLVTKLISKREIIDLLFSFKRSSYA